MKVQLAAGVDIDLATTDDVARIARKVDGLSRTYEPVWTGGNGKTDANGAIELQIAPSVDGKRLVVGRLIIWVDGYTPASPYTASTLWWGIFRGRGQNPASLVDMPIGTYSLPNLSEYSGRNAPTLRQGEDLYLGLTGGPATTNVNVMVQAWYERIWSQTE